jgi:hypothetical protein
MVAEGGKRQPGDGRREGELIVNESKDHRASANIYSIECQTGGEASGCSGVSRRRSQKVEGAIGEKNG